MPPLQTSAAKSKEKRREEKIELAELAYSIILLPLEDQKEKKGKGRDKWPVKRGGRWARLCCGVQEGGEGRTRVHPSDVTIKKKREHEAFSNTYLGKIIESHIKGRGKKILLATCQRRKKKRGREKLTASLRRSTASSPATFQKGGWGCPNCGSGTPSSRRGGGKKKSSPP